MQACPRCSYPLELHLHNHAEVDVCHRCQGTFVYVGDYAPTEALDPDVWMNLSTTEKIGVQEELQCPHGHGPMHGYRVKGLSRSVEIDLCLECGGLWLDKGEAAALQVIGDQAILAEDAELEAKEQPFNIVVYLFQLLTGAPIEVWNPVKNTPYVLYSLVGFMVLLFGYEMYLLLDVGLHEFKDFIGVIGVVPATVVQGGAFWTLLSYAFFHAGLLHIFLNLYFLYIFGDNVEDVLGHTRFFLLFCCTAIAGGLAHAFVYPGSTMPLIGASGAVAGVMGAYLVLFPRVKVWVVLVFIRFKISVVWFFAVWVGMQIFRAVVQFQGGKSNVAWFAHLGGFAVGVLFIFLLGRTKLLDEAGFEHPPEEELQAQH
jgi:membrane associated rhomboid family serine protease/Zn-finger nucleic acid-binding protein